MPENLGKVISLLASADFSSTAGGTSSNGSKQYYGATIDNAGKVRVALKGEKIAGVVVNQPANGQDASVQVDGIAQVMCNGVVVAGALLATDATGQFVTPVGASGDAQVAIALEAGVAGQRISVLLKQFLGAA